MFSGDSAGSLYLYAEFTEDRRPFDLPFSNDFVSTILLWKLFNKIFAYLIFGR